MSNEKWTGLRDLTGQFLVDMFYWASFKSYRTEDRPEDKILVNAILNEAERREWQEGWWGDTSKLPEIRIARGGPPATPGEMGGILNRGKYND